MTEDVAAPKQSKRDLAEISVLVDGLEGQYRATEVGEHARALGIAAEGKGTSQWSNAIHDEIDALLEPNAFGARSQLRSLRRQHLRAHLIEDTPLEPIMSMLEALMSGAAPEVPRETGKEINWHRLIQLGHLQSRLTFPLGMLEYRHPRDVAVGRAAHRLCNQSYKIELGLDGIELPDADRHRLVARLESLVTQIGGLDVTRRIFASIEPHFDVELERYHIVRSIAVARGPSLDTPWGFLLALAGKHFFGTRRHGDPEVSWEELLRLATDFAAIHDTQDYSPPIFENPSPDELLRSLTRRALYDTLFAFPQLRSGDVIRILRPLLSKLDFDRKYGFGWTLEAVLATITRIYDVVGDRRGPVTLDVSHIANTTTGVEPPIVRGILGDLLSHPPEGPNRGYSLPTTQTSKRSGSLVDTGNNLYFRPLIPLDAKRVVVLDRSVAGPAFIEAVLTALRAFEKNDFQNNIVGPGIERLVHEELAAHGIATVTGKYLVDGTDGECDQVIDAPAHLVFLECKAKPITRNASAGNDVETILSLGGSVLAAQEQAMGHEVLLRKYGKLHLQESNHHLEWRDQQVDRIAVALFDFGVFQDRTAVTKLLPHLLPARYGATDQSVQQDKKKEFAKLNDKVLDELEKHLRLWRELGLDHREPFFNCWFLSVPQLLVLLGGVDGQQEFLDRLNFFRKLTYQSFNFYHEFKHGIRLRADVADKN